MESKTKKIISAILKKIGNAKGIDDFNILNDANVNMNHEFDSLEQAKKNVEYWSNELTERLGFCVQVAAVFDGEIVKSDSICSETLSNGRNTISISKSAKRRFLKIKNAPHSLETVDLCYFVGDEVETHKKAKESSLVGLVGRTAIKTYENIALFINYKLSNE